MYFMNTSKLSFKYAPWLSLLLATIIILFGLVPVFQVAFFARFIDLAIKSFNSGSIDPDIYNSILLIVLTVTYLWIGESAESLLSAKIMLKIRKTYRTEIYDKCARLDYKYIEDSSLWDLISRVTKEPEKNIIDGFKAFMFILSMTTNLIGIFVFIIISDWWAVIIISLFGIPLMYFSINSGKANYEKSREVSKIERKYNYFSEILTDREYLDERTLFGFSNKLNERYDEDFEKAFKIKVSAGIKWHVKTRFGSILTCIAGLIVILTLLQPVLSGTLSIGLFMAIINGIFSMLDIISWGLSRNIDTIFKTGEYLRDVNSFMSFEEIPGAMCEPVTVSDIKSIEFCDVSFRYPNTDTFILKDLSFKMERGKHYAFVGANGAGKTTAIKLLTGLYRNYTGRILINGKDIKAYSEEQLKGIFSVVYQDFAKYFFTVKENCAIGDISQINVPGMADRVSKAVSVVGLDDAIQALPEGIDTNLGKIHQNGVDLSGGEWQRLAMSRAIISSAPVCILDEPTASLDPISESEIYELFNKISPDKLTIFISHRLGSTRIADTIFVFDRGKIVEQGDFNLLMRNKGLYREMFEKQRSWYE